LAASVSSRVMEALSGADWEESFLEWEEVKEEKKFEGEDSRAGEGWEGKGGAGEREGAVRVGEVRWVGEVGEEPTDRPGREAKYSSRREKKAS